MDIESPPLLRDTPKPQGERRGLIIVHTGTGKGKSTAAFGLALRAHGRGKRVKVFQLKPSPRPSIGMPSCSNKRCSPKRADGTFMNW